VSTGVTCPLIPVQDRRAIFSIFHGLAHAGTWATRRLLVARVVWRGMNSYVTAWIRDCQQCCRGKVTSQPAAPVHHMVVPAKRFNHVHIDLVGPLPVAEDGSTYILIMIDRTTRWLEAVPLRSTEAATCADAFINMRVTRFSVPAVHIGCVGRLMRLGTDHITTTAYHPYSNGMVERAHRQLKDDLRSRLAGERWSEHLPWMLLGLRAVPKEDNAVSSAELVFRAPLTLPGQLLASVETTVLQVVEALRSIQPPSTR
jgi:hypothetical protein